MTLGVPWSLGKGMDVWGELSEGPKIRISDPFEGYFQRGEKRKNFPQKNWYLEVYLQFTTVAVSLFLSFV